MVVNGFSAQNPARAALALDPVHQEVNGGSAHAFYILFDGREPGLEHIGPLEVVVADQGDVMGHGQPKVLQGMHGANGHGIVQNYQCRRTGRGAAG